MKTEHHVKCLERGKWHEVSDEQNKNPDFSPLEHVSLEAL